MKICKFCNKKFGSLKSHSHHCEERIQKTEKNLKKFGREIIKLYQSGISLNEIKNKFEIGRKPVENYLKNNLIELRTLSESYTPHVRKKQKDTIERIYGNCENISQLEEIKKRVKKTMLEKYGVENISHSQRFKDFMFILKGNALDKPAFNKYKQEIWKLTKKNIKNIPFTELCYYTGVKISKINYFNDFRHVSIDHKISINYGFNNKIPVEIIGNEKNLCYCSRLTNSVKREMTEEEFLRSDIFRRLLFYENQIGSTTNSEIS